MSLSSSSSSASGLDILIVGAGIAGLAAARALRGKHRVTLIEQWGMKSEIGAAIHMGPNAARILLDWGVDLHESPQMTIVREFDQHHNLVSEKQLDPVGVWGAPWLLNHRVTLHRQLYLNATSADGEGQAPKIILGRRVVSCNADDTSVLLDDGTTMQADLIIGADGIKSEVRNTVLGGSEKLVAKPSGHSAYRALIPGDKVKADPELAYLFDQSGVTIYLAGDRRVVAYTCRFEGRDLINVVAAIPDSENPAVAKESWFEKGRVEDLLKAYSDFSPKVKRLLSYTEDCGLWQLRDQDPLDKWSNNAVVVIGDAAHPMLPHLGQGGSQAVEDADMLGYLFSDVARGASQQQIADLLVKFYKYRAFRATFCQESSREQALGARAETRFQIPRLDPLKFSQLLYTYRGAKAWVEEEATRENLERAAASIAVPNEPVVSVATSSDTIALAS